MRGVEALGRVVLLLLIVAALLVIGFASSPWLVAAGVFVCVEALMVWLIWEWGYGDLEEVE